MYTLSVEYRGPFQVQTLARIAFFLPPMQRYDAHLQLYNPRGTLIWDFGVRHVDFPADYIPHDEKELENKIKEFYGRNFRNGLKFLTTFQHHGLQLMSGPITLRDIPAGSIEVLVNRFSEE